MAASDEGPPGKVTSPPSITAPGSLSVCADLSPSWGSQSSRELVRRDAACVGTGRRESVQVPATEAITGFFGGQASCGTRRELCRAACERHQPASSATRPARPCPRDGIERWTIALLKSERRPGSWRSWRFMPTAASCGFRWPTERRRTRKSCFTCGDGPRLGRRLPRWSDGEAAPASTLGSSVCCRQTAWRPEAGRRLEDEHDSAGAPRHVTMTVPVPYRPVGSEYWVEGRMLSLARTAVWAQPCASRRRMRPPTGSKSVDSFSEM